MGLLDSVIGSVTGSKQESSSSMSPLVKALLLLFGDRAASRHIGGSSKSQGDTAQPSGTPDAKPGTIQTGILKGLPSLESIMERFKRGGHDAKTQSWGGRGETR